MASEALVLYRHLRGELLRATAHHRRQPGEAHRGHLAAHRAQLGALRRAWRGTCEAARWNAYARARANRRLTAWTEG